MATLFISDLHLEAGRPDIIQNFMMLNEEFIHRIEAYYILGDFLEYWLGDDDPADALVPALESLQEISNKGIEVFLMHGNRDFLIGEAFTQRWQLKLLPDPTVIDLYGEKTLLMHGDMLCTDDIKYQAFRKQVRSQAWQQDFLSKSLKERQNIVNSLRAISNQETLDKTDDIMDVNQQEVIRVMETYKVKQLIHGHTHRPAVHNIEVKGHAAKRIVLGDWHKKSSYLLVDGNQYTFEK